jgi:hypothetical protein
MSITPTVQSPIKTPLSSPLPKPLEQVTPSKVSGMFPDNVQVDTFTRLPKRHNPFPNSEAPRDTPVKKKKRSEPQEKEKIEHRKTVEAVWPETIEEMLGKLDDDEDKATIRATITEALEESKNTKGKLHDEKISRKYPSVESLADTITLMLFIKKSQSIHLDTWRDGKEKHHFLVRCLQDGTAGHCLTAFQEFFGDTPTSSTRLVKDTNHNNLCLIRKLPPGGAIQEARYLAISLGESIESEIKEKKLITPVTLIPLKKTTFQNKLTIPGQNGHHRYVVVSKKTGEPVTRYQDLIPS